MHNVDDLILIFNQCFMQSHRTKLVYGDDEPLYLPAQSETEYHQILFAHGFFSSALHECAHWLLAGDARRQQVDYGYWYIPDGRNAEEQKLFQQVEIKPQALEWILSDAAGYRFQFSIDNLDGNVTDLDKFQYNVMQQKLIYEQQGLSGRAAIFQAAIKKHYQCSDFSRSYSV
jgi:elongation factor P hydroxylase